MKMRGIWLVAVLATFAAAGCGGDPSGPPEASSLPDGAIALTMNQPDRGSIEGLVVVAANIDDSGAYLRGWRPATDQPGTGDRVDVGGTIDIEGTTLRLVATWVDPDPGQGDGGSRSEAWVVVEE